jgi:hypothetical protein
MENYNKYNKNISLGLLICIIIILIGSIVYQIINFISSRIFIEQFFNKRNTRMKIYKSDEIFDPDESAINNDEDPDTNPKYDPDQQQYY